MKTLLALLLPALALADGIPFSGRLTDAEGKPAAGAILGAEWNNRSGSLSPLQPWKTDAEGRFGGELHWVNRPMALLALDAARTHGAMRIVEEKDLKAPMEIDLKLGDVSEVKGSLACPAIGASLGVTTVVVEQRPSGARIYRLTIRDDRFSVPLPPGDYTVRALAYDAKELTRDFSVEAGGKGVDLGALALEATEIVAHWGKAPPAFSATAVRGMAAVPKLADLKGKWVLLVFWNAASDDATRVLFPRLLDLAARHKDAAEKFTILALHDPTAKTWDDYEAKVKKLKAGPWEGKDPGFPLLLDATGDTWKAWGIDAPLFVALVDPEGNVVKRGSDTVLDQKLSGK